MKLRPLISDTLHIITPGRTVNAAGMGPAACAGEWQQARRVTANPDHIRCERCKAYLRRHGQYYNLLIAKVRSA